MAAECEVDFPGALHVPCYVQFVVFLLLLEILLTYYNLQDKDGIILHNLWGVLACMDCIWQKHLSASLGCD